MKKVILFLCQGLEEYEASVFTDAFGWTTTYGIEPIELITVGLRPKVKCAWNFTIKPEYQLSEIDINDFDALAIPGGMSRSGFYEDAYDERLLSLIRDFDSKGKIIASVCVGALPIAKSGVLNGRNGTTYHLSKKRQTQMEEMGVNVIQAPIVIDKNIITSRSPSAAMDVAFKVVEMLTSTANLKRIKEGMGFIEKTDV
ncbi:DJ-1/PfpI family protein [Photobacterium damselae]|uniref:DJ-1/PfpI family protein n=1 Tax=Photobacterium damselae TaxID=38293 RepID=UPI00083B95D7|nr:DJ-1/PfpI family protein [Photobacterium damselae]KAB1175031.1 DJ-1/PfpI family protein [Photobacterium damselae subsp. damselae]NVO75311.1 DJ-1/PfpI family protein [Photobacterium damselae subsp. damselae]PSB86235.1 DJ-1 family protein [Photobacterium damselae subsp. damselae]PSB90578.1 DJ-1 family protein [Photobacterium damselae subsp. damselae]SPY31305.1 General stress protein 18 [Photobacterium damselae]